MLTAHLKSPGSPHYTTYMPGVLQVGTSHGWHGDRGLGQPTQEAKVACHSMQLRETLSQSLKGYKELGIWLSGRVLI